MRSFFVFFVALALGTAEAEAATITINTGSDAALASTDCANVPDCSTGSCTLRQAAFAGTCSGVSTTIIIAATVPTITIDGTAGRIVFGYDGSVAYTSAPTVDVAFTISPPRSSAAVRLTVSPASTPPFPCSMPSRRLQSR